MDFERHLKTHFHIPNDIKNDIVYCQRAIKDHSAVQELLRNQAMSDPEQKKICLDEMENLIKQINLEQNFLFSNLQPTVDNFYRTVKGTLLLMDINAVNNYISDVIDAVVNNERIEVQPVVVTPRSTKSHLQARYRLQEEKALDDIHLNAEQNETEFQEVVEVKVENSYDIERSNDGDCLEMKEINEENRTDERKSLALDVQANYTANLVEASHEAPTTSAAAAASIAAGHSSCITKGTLIKQSLITDGSYNATLHEATTCATASSGTSPTEDFPSSSTDAAEVIVSDNSCNVASHEAASKRRTLLQRQSQVSKRFKLNPIAVAIASMMANNAPGKQSINDITIVKKSMITNAVAGVTVTAAACNVASHVEPTASAAGAASGKQHKNVISENITENMPAPKRRALLQRQSQVSKRFKLNPIAVAIASMKANNAPGKQSINDITIVKKSMITNAVAGVTVTAAACNVASHVEPTASAASGKQNKNVISENVTKNMPASKRRALLQRQSQVSKRFKLNPIAVPAPEPEATVAIASMMANNAPGKQSINGITLVKKSMITNAVAGVTVTAASCNVALHVEPTASAAGAASGKQHKNVISENITENMPAPKRRTLLQRQVQVKKCYKSDPIPVPEATVAIAAPPSVKKAAKRPRTTADRNSPSTQKSSSQSLMPSEPQESRTLPEHYGQEMFLQTFGLSTLAKIQEMERRHSKRLRQKNQHADFHYDL